MSPSVGANRHRSRWRPGSLGPSTREEQLEAEAEVADLTQALGEAAVELRIWKKLAEGRLAPEVRIAGFRSVESRYESCSGSGP